ncbi:DNA-binding transcriptional regulator, XRE-family HTH domain [Pseudomonas citronellolis]|jgi:transcriptional regulator with XRE-family HTH domain|uniref:DNA-binding transcriptional regulator, XRE-family HTH domain n=1 Tax=Pseudomonas citronellolis TaxID=53408 RepID=A0AAQ1KP51_9PSED|nr:MULTISPECIES: helix-turn-helix transcriptional regulator [Pseudomonas]MCL6687766.1 helix-turn-helix domain-containing protein [Pseudomonas sp. R3.Fl]MCP1640718.1 transcriptional regulator with XRE-family HTH domain [Pseudomonas citronellolis]MCP1663638.1 transcriptional regulator with XRE-family HTH domain [Pseudomonas citronellolis]MCP1696060.1 transcriptional regulator with XRE-family HTH domain [Pseudomonas citronellolis]MCP1701551.1 transcriptional regulator with XRE-family HTH domain [
MKGRNVVHEVGAAIANRRRAKGLTQAQIAEGIGVEKETISRMENGVISPTLHRLGQIAEILECPLSDLFRKDSIDVAEQAEAIGDLLQELAESERVLVVNLIGEIVKVLKGRRSH